MVSIMSRLVITPRLLGITASVLFVILVASLPTFYFYNQYKETKKLLGTGSANPQEAKDLVEKVGKLIDLPEGEIPTIATVADPEKLKAQPFFAKAKTGDKVLIFQQAKKAFLYDPVANKIIEVGPVSSSTISPPAPAPETQKQASPEAKPKEETLLIPSSTEPVLIKTVLLNGTTTTGLTSVIEKPLKETIPNIQIVDKGNAKKRDYEKTLVIDLTGQNKEIALRMSEITGGEISELPDTESMPPDAQILIIVGEDKK